MPDHRAHRKDTSCSHEYARVCRLGTIIIPQNPLAVPGMNMPENHKPRADPPYLPQQLWTALPAIIKITPGWAMHKKHVCVVGNPPVPYLADGRVLEGERAALLGEG